MGTTAVRAATIADNRGLLALAASCSMRGETALRIQREPDFFALNRLEGDDWQVAVLDAYDRLAGCIASGERSVYINGAVTRTGYVGDLKVHPAHRNAVVADALCNYAGARMDRLPKGAPTLITVLAGNKAMERRLPGPRGVPSFEWLATVRSHSVPILWKRRLPNAASITVARAGWADIDDMCALWRNVASARQFAPVFDSKSLASWIGRTPGVDIGSYILARSKAGALLGFIALWDQSSFKQMYVERFSRRMELVVAAMNTLAPMMGGARMPELGENVAYQTALHVCVQSETPEVLGSLLASAHNDLRNSGVTFFNIGLDVIDPLTAALKGLHAQPTDVNAYLGTRAMTPLDMDSYRRLPLHYEIGLV